MSDMVKDILLKAAEDVQSGMWCQGTWFESPERAYTDGQLFEGLLTVEAASGMKRCAEGSIALAVVLLGGEYPDFWESVKAVGRNLGAPLAIYNDGLPDDPFTAGQTLAELFRSTAESL